MVTRKAMAPPKLMHFASVFSKELDFSTRDSFGGPRPANIGELSRG